jgi:ABC-type multidrug transport system fused ATPase/permease subunit
VLDQGRIAEFGNHEQLMERGGIYHHLYSTQFNREPTVAS